MEAAEVVHQNLADVFRINDEKLGPSGGVNTNDIVGFFILANLVKVLVIELIFAHLGD